MKTILSMSRLTMTKSKMMMKHKISFKMASPMIRCTTKLKTTKKKTNLMKAPAAKKTKMSMSKKRRVKLISPSKTTRMIRRSRITQSFSEWTPTRRSIKNSCT